MWLSAAGVILTLDKSRTRRCPALRTGVWEKMEPTHLYTCRSYLLEVSSKRKNEKGNS